MADVLERRLGEKHLQLVGTSGPTQELLGEGQGRSPGAPGTGPRGQDDLGWEYRHSFPVVVIVVIIVVVVIVIVVIAVVVVVVEIESVGPADARDGDRRPNCRSFQLIFYYDLLRLQRGAHRVVFNTRYLLFPQLLVVGINFFLRQSVAVLVDLLQPQLGSLHRGFLFRGKNRDAISIIYIISIGRRFFSISNTITSIIMIICNNGVVTVIVLSFLRFSLSNLGEKIEITFLRFS